MTSLSADNSIYNKISLYRRIRQSGFLRDNHNRKITSTGETQKLRGQILTAKGEGIHPSVRGCRISPNCGPNMRDGEQGESPLSRQPSTRYKGPEPTQQPRSCFPALGPRLYLSFHNRMAGVDQISLLDPRTTNVKEKLNENSGPNVIPSSYVTGAS
jgi:hypothetical protein